MGARQPPLVGRTALVRDLARTVAAGGSVLLTGPAGIGKTRVAHELCRLESAGGSTERVLATAEASGRPLATLVPLGVVSEDDDALSAFGKVLRRWTGSGVSGVPMLLWLDDAHHTDPATATLVRHAVVAGVIRLVATHREHLDLPPDLEALVTEGLLERHRLVPLAGRDAALLARVATAPHRLTATQRESIASLAEGNPLYVRELARAAAGGDRDLVGAPTLDLLVGRAALGLDPAARRVLDMVAVAEPAPRGLLCAARSEITRLRALGLVEPHGDDALRTDHPLRRAWLLRELGPHRSEVMGALLDEVERAPHHAPDALTLLGWYDVAGRPAGPGLLERAARTAIARGRPREAEQVAGRLDGDLSTMLRAQARIVDGDVDGGLEVLDDLALNGATPLRLEALWWSVRYHGLVSGRVTRAEALIRAVEQTETGPDVARALVRARLWLWAFRGAGPDADIDLARRQVETAGPGPERIEMLAAVLAVMGNARGLDGTGGVADELADELAAADDACPEWPQERLRARTALGWHRAATLRADLAAATLTEGFEQARRWHDPEAVLALGGSGAMILTLVGRVGEALDLSTSRPGDPEGHGWLRMDELRRATHAAALCYAGDAAGTRAELDTLVANGAEGAPEPMTLLLLRLRRLVDEVHGAPDDDAVLAALERAGARCQLMYLAVVALETIDLRAAPDAVVALVRALRRGEGGIVGLAARIFADRCEGRAAPLLEAGLQLESGALVVPALRVVPDAIRLARDDAEVVARGRAAVLRLLARWDGVEPWWIDDGVPSPRQREVAQLVASGRTPAEVAEQLVLSRRTVENHLQAVYGHLDVHSRDGLVAALRPT
jgi:DNA-binding CsgD family transcriptional regulator